MYIYYYIGVHVDTGVHSLGGCNSNVSGYSGVWDTTPRALDSNYYENMMKTGWQVEKRLEPAVDLV